MKSIRLATKNLDLEGNVSPTGSWLLGSVNRPYSAVRPSQRNVREVWFLVKNKAPNRHSIVRLCVVGA